MRQRLILIGFAATAIILIIGWGGVTLLVSSTSAVELPPAPLSTATPPPSASPARVLGNSVDRDPTSPIAQTDLTFVDTQQLTNTDPACTSHSQWHLFVNPQDVIGSPHVSSPSPADWHRALQALAFVRSLCPAAVLLSWVSNASTQSHLRRNHIVLNADTVYALSDGGALQRTAYSLLQMLPPNT